MSRDKFTKDNVRIFLLNLNTINSVCMQAVSGSKISYSLQSGRTLVLYMGICTVRLNFEQK